MANNYTQGTVEPDLPKALFTPLELKLLSAFGFHTEASAPSDDSSLYFFAPEGEICEPLFGITISEVKADASPVAKKLLTLLDNALADDDEQSIEVPYKCTSWVEIFQLALRRASKADKLDDIVYQGCYSCSKMRPGEFGGFVIRITRNYVQSNGTAQTLDAWRKRSRKAAQRRTSRAAA